MKGNRRSKGFRSAADLVSDDVRRASQARGFAEARLLTAWPEIAGADVAAICRPVKVTWPRAGNGAVLTLLTTGAQAPMLAMRAPAIRERVNAAYGYAAVGRIAVTQTAPEGFAEGRADFAPARPAPASAPGPETLRAAQTLAAGISDDALRRSLERLGAAIISKRPH